MRHAIKLLTIFSLSFGVDAAISEDGGWNIGIGFGDVTASYEMANFADGSVTEGVVDNSDSAWKIFDGNEINRHFAIEVGFADLHNDADNRMTFSGISNGTGSRNVSLPVGEVSVDIDDISGYFIKAIGSLPSTMRFGVSARVGAVVWDAQQKMVDLDRRDLTTDGTNALIGVGMEYRLDNGIRIHGEAERFFDMGGTDQDSVGFSISYHS